MIRTMRPADTEAVLAIWLAANRDAHPFVPAAYWEANLPAVREQLPQAEVYVLERGGVIQGFLGLTGTYIAGLFVAAAHRGQGAGRLLLDRAKAEHRALTLQVYRKNIRAAAFYAREGFVLSAQGTDAATGEEEWELCWQAAQSAPPYRLVRLAEEPAMLGPAARWFHEKWDVPQAEYRRSMAASLEAAGPVPQWYLALDGARIVGGAGVIENDFHERRDLAPNLCALYVEPDRRGRGIAGALLDFACRDMQAQGVGTLYLVTEHTGLYERYGWDFLGMVQETGAPGAIRMYARPTAGR